VCVCAREERGSGEERERGGGWFVNFQLLDTD
jgi:hypothetical protein